jgi:hypothetical protein
MGKKPKPQAIQQAAEGSPQDRELIKEEEHLEAAKLAKEMPSSPADRQIYVRNVTARALHGEISLAVFKLFIVMTNSWMELERCAPRAKLLAEIKRGG